MPARSFRRPLVAAFAGAALLFGASGFGCAIDLSDALAGRPCKDRQCLRGYTCSEMNTCVRDGTASTGGADAAVDGNGGATAAGGDGAAGLGGGGAPGDGSLDGPSPLPDAPSGTRDGATGGTGGTDGGNVPLSGVACREFRCDSDESCCVGSYPGFPSPAADFSCQSGGDTCPFTLRCDGDHDCGSGEVCCLAQSNGDWVAECTSSCASPGVHIECSIPAHCGSGLACCGQWDFGSNGFSSVQCASACNGSVISGERIFCADDNDCNTTASCQESDSLPGLRICQ